jgi:hypothetical protein
VATECLPSAAEVVLVEVAPMGGMLAEMERDGKPRPHAPNKINDPDRVCGLEPVVLRADLHTLFDRGMIGVDTQTWTVVVSDALAKTVSPVARSAYPASSSSGRMRSYWTSIEPMQGCRSTARGRSYDQE